MTIEELGGEMWAFNQEVAGDGPDVSEAWRDFLDACLKDYGVLPWDAPQGFEVSEEFAFHWQSVSEGKSYAYSAATGAREEE